MSDTDALGQEEWHTLMRIILSVVGFILSIIFICCGMFMLVRFWLITDLYYLFYMISTIFIGIIFTIFSSNLFLFTDVMSNTTIWPYLWFTPVTIFWNFFGIIQPYKSDGYYNKYSYIPIVNYPHAFYNGDSCNETFYARDGYTEMAATQDHIFGKAYKQGSIFFDNQTAVVSVLFVLLLTQILFWMVAVAAYVPIFRDYVKRKNVKIL